MSFPEESIQKIITAFPGREKQIKELVFKVNSKWPVVFVHGHRGTGKSSIVRQVVSHSLDAFSIVYVAGMSSPKEAYAQILMDIRRYSEPQSDVIEQFGLCVCDDAKTFVDKLKTFISESKISRIIIVLDSIEGLQDRLPHFITVMSKLHEWLEAVAQITVIMISSEPPHEFLRPGVVLFPPLVISFPAYTKEELVTILSSKKPPGYSLEMFDNYVQTLLSVLYDITRSAGDIIDIAERMFPVYIDPITKGLATEKDTVILWKHFEPHLKTLPSSVITKGQAFQTLIEDLPFATRYLLLAAYLVSFNSKSSDKRFFVKEQTRHISRKANNRAEESGPKMFPLERLLHVYRSLLDLNECYEEDDLTSIASESILKEPSVEILSQLEDLVSMRLLIRSGGTGSSLSSVKKWKLSDSVTFDYIQSIAKSVNFDLCAHLESFTLKK